jgi:hypothetical protein
MKKFNTEEKKKIEGSRTSIQLLLQVQDHSFRTLCEEIGILDETDISWLFDYIYNTTDDSSEYVTYVKEKIYGGKE